jgi:transcriptional regulator with XRE-family HTH domain
MTDIYFPNWLINELDKKKWKPADLSRIGNIDSGFLSKVLNGERNPGPTFLDRVASALHYPPEFVFRMAGLLPPEREGNPEDKELLHLFDRLNQGEKKEILEWVRFKVEKRKK